MQDKKVIIITGANSGIGKVTAIELSKNGDIVVMVCRDKIRGEKALLEVIEASGNENVQLMLCDLSSFSDIKRFCNEFKKQFNSLDILINNAGTMIHERKLTIDGFEMHWQVNYLAPFLLTHLLLDSINPNGRIINVASLAHKMGKIHFEDINLNNHFSMFRAYAQSKLALILFTYELANRLNGITVNCLHPGTIVSNLGIYKDKKIINVLTNQLKWIFASPEKGAQTSIYLATSPDVATTSGSYFNKKKAIKSSEKSHNQLLAKKLWDYTEELLNLK